MEIGKRKKISENGVERKQNENEANQNGNLNATANMV